MLVGQQFLEGHLGDHLRGSNVSQCELFPMAKFCERRYLQVPNLQISQQKPFKTIQSLFCLILLTSTSDTNILKSVDSVDFSTLLVCPKKITRLQSQAQRYEKEAERAEVEAAAWPFFCSFDQFCILFNVIL